VFMQKPKLRPIAFVLSATNHGSMLVNRFDYRLVENSGYGVGYQLLNNSCFDPNEIDFALQLLQARKEVYGDGLVALDCGANIGVHTIEWAKFMHGFGEVIAFEAQERIFYALAGNITLNNCFNARAIWAAVGESSGVLNIPVPNYFSPSSFGSLELKQNNHNEFIGQAIDYSADKLTPTRLMTIDELALKRLDFIKIDIEGMEMEALRGGINSIREYKPIMMIERIKSNETEISNWATDLGYKIFNLGINILCVHNSDTVINRIQVN
jgi:FkbM family methyltransferase